MKLTRFIFIVIALLAAVPAFGQESIFYGQVMYGGGWYNKEGDDHSDYAAGAAFGYVASRPLSFEGQVLYSPVGGDDYYFLLVGARYRFLNADFFMTPSLGLHGGVLFPYGEKTDIDGVVGMSASLLYSTRWGLDFGPQLSGNAVFEGPHVSAWVNCMGVIRYNF